MATPKEQTCKGEKQQAGGGITDPVLRQAAEGAKWAVNDFIGDGDMSQEEAYQMAQQFGDWLAKKGVLGKDGIVRYPSTDSIET